MPLFEYECRECKARFEQLVPNARSAHVTCRKCGSPSVSQLLSVFSVAGSSRREVEESGPCGSCGAAQRGLCSI